MPPAARCTTVVFYGAAAYNAAPATFDATRLHQHAAHDRRPGQRLLRLHASPARTRPGSSAASPASTPTATASGSPAATAAGDAAIDKVAMNCAPALSPDAQTLYVAVNTDAGRRPVQARLPARARQHDARAEEPSAAARSGVRHAGARSATTRPVADRRPRRRRLLRRPRDDLRHAQRARLAAPLRRHAGDAIDARRLRLGRHGVDRAGVDGAVVRRAVDATC